MDQVRMDGATEGRHAGDFPTRDGTPLVYFVAAPEVGRIKIGVSTTLGCGGRAKSIATGSPVNVKLLGYQWGDRRLEIELHDRFSAYSVGGEWFELCPEIQDYVSQHAIKNWVDGIYPLPETTRKPLEYRSPRPADEDFRSQCEDGMIRVAMDLESEGMDTLRREYVHCKGRDRSPADIIRWAIKIHTRKWARRHQWNGVGSAE